MPISSTLGALATLSLVSSLWCLPVLGQWVVAAEVGADRFWGGSIERTAEQRSFRPYRPTTFGVGLERRAGKLGLGLRLGYASAGLALEGAEGVVAAKGVFTVYSATPEVVYRLTSVAVVNHLDLHLGPLFEVWSIIDENAQTRVGVQAAVSLSVPLGGKFAGSFTAGAALTPSPFERDQLDAAFEPQALWRRRVAAGLEYRL